MNIQQFNGQTIAINSCDASHEKPASRQAPSSSSFAIDNSQSEYKKISGCGSFSISNTFASNWKISDDLV